MDNLKKYLHQEFNSNNHNKYHKYFITWFNNLTDNQIYWFKIQMNK